MKKSLLLLMFYIFCVGQAWGMDDGQCIICYKPSLQKTACCLASLHRICGEKWAKNCPNCRHTPLEIIDIKPPTAAPKKKKLDTDSYYSSSENSSWEFSSDENVPSSYDEAMRTIPSAAASDMSASKWKETILYGDHRSCNCVAFSPDGTMLAAGYDATDSGYLNHTVFLWDLKTNQKAKVLQGHHFNDVNTVAFSPLGKILACSGGYTDRIYLWKTQTKKMHHDLLGEDYTQNSPIAFNPDGTILVAGAGDGPINFWRVHQRKLFSFSSDLLDSLEGHKLAVRAVAFSTDGTRVASSSADCTVGLWDLTKKKMFPLAGHNDGIGAVTFNPNNSAIIASGSDDKTVKLWDIRIPTAKIRTLRGHNSRIYSVAYNPEGKTLASGSRDGTIRLWDMRNDKAEILGNRHEESYYSKKLDDCWFHPADTVYSVAWSPDGKTLAAGLNDGTVHLWQSKNYTSESK